MAGDVWTIRDTLDWCRTYLEKHGDENPRLSAEWLLSAATQLTRVELYMNFDKPLSASERAELRESLKRRGKGEPLQYISGAAAFRHIVVQTAQGVLIPRPETELLVDEVLAWAEKQTAEGKQSLRVLEVGCGTGCIALSLAKEAGIEVTTTDVSPQAVACAQRNAAALELDELVHVIRTDCVAGIEGSFDILVSNPPYIPTALMDELPHEVAGFEPHLALDGGEDGLVFFERLLSEALPLLREGGFFACELHETCLDEAARRLEAAGMQQVHATCDLAQRPRIVNAVQGVH